MVLKCQDSFGRASIVLHLGRKAGEKLLVVVLAYYHMVPDTIGTSMIPDTRY